MARYRKVEQRIWHDEKFQSLDPLDKYLALYCLTAQCNRIGIFKFSLALAAEETGIPISELQQRLDRVCHTLSWSYDIGYRILYFPTWWKYNNPGSPKTMAGLLADIDELPSSPLLARFFSNTKYLPDSLCHTLCQKNGKGMPYQEQEQEQEQEYIHTHMGKWPKVSKLFAKWLKLYQEKHGQRLPPSQMDSVAMDIIRRGEAKAERDLEFSILKGAKSILDSSSDFQRHRSGKADLGDKRKQIISQLEADE